MVETFLNLLTAIIYLATAIYVSANSDFLKKKYC